MHSFVWRFYIPVVTCSFLTISLLQKMTMLLRTHMTMGTILLPHPEGPNIGPRFPVWHENMLCAVCMSSAMKSHRSGGTTTSLPYFGRSNHYYVLSLWMVALGVVVMLLYGRVLWTRRYLDAATAIWMCAIRSDSCLYICMVRLKRQNKISQLLEWCVGIVHIKRETKRSLIAPNAAIKLQLKVTPILCLLDVI